MSNLKTMTSCSLYRFENRSALDASYDKVLQGLFNCKT